MLTRRPARGNARRARRDRGAWPSVEERRHARRCWSPPTAAADAGRADRRRCGLAAGGHARAGAGRTRPRGGRGRDRHAQRPSGSGCEPGDRVRIGRASFACPAIIDKMPRDVRLRLRAAGAGRRGRAGGDRADPAGQHQHAPAIACSCRQAPTRRPSGKAFQRRFPDGGWRATDRNDAGSGTRRFIDRLGQMLLLVALSALAIGGLGMSSAAAAFAASRRPSIAILKLVGAPRADDQRHAAGRARADRRARDPRRAGGRRGGARRWSPSSPDRLLPVAPDPSPQWRALGRGGPVRRADQLRRELAGDRRGGRHAPGAIAARRRRRRAAAALRHICRPGAGARRRRPRSRSAARATRSSPRPASAASPRCAACSRCSGSASGAWRARLQASRRADHAPRHCRARPARRGDRCGWRCRSGSA